MRKQWFEEWFETNYYKLLYNQRDIEEANQFGLTLSTYLKLQPLAKILDVGCGRGRYSNAFMELGYDVTGIDISIKKIEENLKFQNENLHFYKHDMRRLFRINYFDAVLSLFTSFGYFESYSDEKSAARSMAANLKWGAYLVIDYLNPHELTKNFIPNDEFEKEGINFNIFRTLHPNYVRKEIYINDHGKILNFKEQVRLYKVNDLITLFEPFEMKFLHSFGNYKLEKFEADVSERMILIFQKTKS
ncbi:MAG: class I SAM-dependent methyltransferase [Saprospiraceae bacterium]|nr:class I SAM-dependent methyltransferase [Saprospiraceae bacterium]